MSWLKKHLKENKNNNLETFSDLSSLIREVYEDKVIFNRYNKQAETSLLRERFESGKGATMTLQAIPEIAVSELGWTNIVGGEEGEQEVSGPERRKLEQFLSSIQGNNFREKIQSLAKFYDDPDAAMQSMFPENSPSMPQQIAAALGYLTFFKTLTKVISNFNAASAGFNFEAFLSVLSGGEQVKANTGTIADFISRADGSNMPISLKLYQEGKLHVGGSFTDLANDLYEQKEQFDYPFMRYLAVTKEFDGGQKEGLDINGKLRWFQFDFTIDNVFDLISQSSLKSRKCIQLPVDFISGRTSDYAATLPGSAIPSPQELENVFIEALNIELQQHNELYPDLAIDPDLRDRVLQDLNWSSEDSYFQIYDPDRDYLAKLEKKGEDVPDDFERTPGYVSRGDSRMGGRLGSPQVKALQSVIMASLQDAKADEHPLLVNLDEKGIKSLTAQIFKRVRDANNGGKKTVAGENSVLSTYSKSKLKDERLSILKNKGEPSSAFASIEDSLAWYNKRGRTEDQKKAALKQCYGYLTTEQFNLNQAVVEKVHTLSTQRVLAEGQEKPEFGTIFIGAQNTQNMLDRMTGLINDAIFGIFLSVKNVQENTYAYMAGGMTEEPRADAAIDASNDIIKKTRDLKSSKEEKS